MVRGGMTAVRRPVRSPVRGPVREMRDKLHGVALVEASVLNLDEGEQEAATRLKNIKIGFLKTDFMHHQDAYTLKPHSLMFKIPNVQTGH